MADCCVVCGTQSEGCICEACKSNTDIEKLCHQIIAYRPSDDNPNANPMWDEIIEELGSVSQFVELAFELADYLDSPRREYVMCCVYSSGCSGIYKKHRNSFKEIYPLCVNQNGLSDLENNRIKGLMLDLMYSEYNYSEADELATVLIGEKDLPWQTVYSLVDFYAKTRRYDEADTVLEEHKNKFADANVLTSLEKVEASNNKYRDASEKGKKEYFPSPRENKEEAVKNYVDFLNSLGIDVAIKKSAPKPLTKASYPDVIVTENADFDSFVAFDFETTGFSPKTDAIIEVGAVKVINGQIVETEEYLFSEFVRPFQRKVTPIITKVTGITPEDVAEAREMWEVIPDFMKFVGDLPLVGYNSVGFDSRFLARAGRYSHIEVNNPHYDVLCAVRKNAHKIKYAEDNCKLGTVAEFFGIKNPAAHRAWADALTTAKVYLKLKELL